MSLSEIIQLMGRVGNTHDGRALTTKGAHEVYR